VQSRYFSASGQAGDGRCYEAWLDVAHSSDERANNTKRISEREAERMEPNMIAPGAISAHVLS